jgi:hypothetical protein
VRTTEGIPATPLAVDDVALALTEAMRAMLQRRPATELSRLDGESRNVQRYGAVPFALACVMVPRDGHVYAHWGLPVLAGRHPFFTRNNDPVSWFDDVGRIPNSRSAARAMLQGIATSFG